MYTESTKTLADAVNEYFSQYELEELCGQYDIELKYSGTAPNHLELAKNLLGNISAGQNRRFLKALLSDLLIRCNNRIENADREDSLYHQQMILQLKKFKRFLTMKPPAVKAQLQSADHLISDMLDLVAFFGRAKTDVTVVDTDLGDATLDCLKKVQSRIKLLTCQQPDRFEQNFTKALSHFRQKGRKIEIRMHADIHDRYIVFNDKCWLASMPVKNVDEPGFNLIEIVDSKSVIIKQLEKKWKKSEVIIVG